MAAKPEIVEDICISCKKSEYCSFKKEYPLRKCNAFEQRKRQERQVTLVEE